VFASQQGNGGSDGPLNAIAAAAERTQNEPGGRATMEAIVSSSSQPAPFTITGQMVFDAEGRTQAVLMVPRPDSHGSVKMDAVSDGTAIYMRSSQFGSLPEGREWMGLNLSLGQGSDVPLPANVDAKGELELLESVSDDVRKLGVEDVHGVRTTHYRGTVSVVRLIERLREEGMDDLASVTEKKGTPVEVEAWIDADGLLRRMRVVQTQPGEGGEGSATIDMRMDFIEFGIDPEIDVPDSSEVFDMTPLIKEKLSVSSD
jgi:hypothetical protein